MPAGRNPLSELDERTARLGRDWYAQVRRQDAADREELRREVEREKPDTGADGDSGSWDGSSGDDSDGCDGGD